MQMVSREWRAAARRAQLSALTGAALWLVLLFIPFESVTGIAAIERLLLLGVLVIVPLGLSLLTETSGDGSTPFIYRIATLAQPFGAVAAVASLMLEQGTYAGLLACVWLAVTGLVALHGVARVLTGGGFRAEELSLAAGLSYLSVGGAWFVMSRLGWQPLGFGSTIVLLTAVHFHYAGFAAPLLAGLAGKFLRARAARLCLPLTVAAACIILGTPLVAAGITLSPALGLVGTIIVASGLVLLGVLIIGWIVPRVDTLIGRLLLTISAAASSSAMVLACLYAYSIVAQRLIISIPQMAVTHGLANAFGFSLCGLVAWALIQRREHF